MASEQDFLKAIEGLTDEVASLRRALVGDVGEGNLGVLNRLMTLERRVERLWWTFPLLVTGGTAIGQLVAGWLGL